eukprot:68275-Chlamydomonas_euryale.AAC.2
MAWPWLCACTDLLRLRLPARLPSRLLSISCLTPDLSPLNTRAGAAHKSAGSSCWAARSVARRTHAASRRSSTVAVTASAAQHALAGAATSRAAAAGECKRGRGQSATQRGTRRHESLGSHVERVAQGRWSQRTGTACNRSPRLLSAHMEGLAVEHGPRRPRAAQPAAARRNLRGH